MTYRHITNLCTPFDGHDHDLLIQLQDYKLGEPVEAEPSEDVEPVPLATMKANGIIGVYAPWESMEREGFQRMTGWDMLLGDWLKASKL